MMKPIKSTLLFLFQPKAILFGISIFLFIYVYVSEWRDNHAFGCYDCGFYTRQVLLLLTASSVLLIKRTWSVIISLLCSLKIVYTIGYLAFWNMAIRSDVSHPNNLIILRDSISWAYEWKPILFIELIIALIIIIYAKVFLWQRISQKFFRNQVVG